MKSKHAKAKLCRYCGGLGYDQYTYEECEYCEDGFVYKQMSFSKDDEEELKIKFDK